jgi:hypothetical protein
MRRFATLSSLAQHHVTRFVEEYGHAPSVPPASVPMLRLAIATPRDFMRRLAMPEYS